MVTGELLVSRLRFKEQVQLDTAHTTSLSTKVTKATVELTPVGAMIRFATGYVTVIPYSNILEIELVKDVVPDEMKAFKPADK